MHGRLSVIGSGAENVIPAGRGGREKAIVGAVCKHACGPEAYLSRFKTISVISAKDQSTAGDVTEGDLLKLEPGQAEALKDAHENTPVTMRVITSKGEEGEVPAGTLIVVPKDVQQFDNEFHAKLDLGLAEADKNQELFRKGAQ
jgi:hypothetical protein